MVVGFALEHQLVMHFSSKMKYTIASWVCWFMVSGSISAQTLSRGFTQPVEHKNALKINLLSSFYSTINLSYQHVISNTHSWNITASYMDFDSYGSTVNPSDSLTNGGSSEVKSQRTQGIAIIPEYRYVLNGRGLSGMYIAPFLRYSYYEYHQVAIYDSTYYNSQAGYYMVKTEYHPDLFAYHTLAVGCIFGKQVLFKNRISFDFFCGPSYSILVSSNKDIKSPADVVIGPGISNVYIKGLGLRGGITIGFTY